MKPGNRVIALSIIFGLSTWVIDAVIDCVIFHEGTFWGLLALDASGHGIFMRSVIPVSFVIFGIIISRVMGKRKEEEEALRAGEKKMYTTLNSIGDAVIATDMAGHVAQMNPVAEELTGWKREEASGRPLSEVFNIVNVNTGEPVENPVERIICKGKIVGLANDTLLIARDGTESRIAESAAPIQADDGSFQGVVLVFRDVTEEYGIQKSLQESEKRFRELADLLPQTVFEMDLKGNITYINLNAFKTFGYTRNDFDKGLNAFQMLITRDRSKLEKNIGRALRGEGTGPNEYEMIRKDGCTFSAITRSSPIIREDKQVGIRGTVIDTTEIKLVEKMLQHEQNKFQSMLGALGEGMYIVNRDFVVEYQNDIVRDRFGDVIGEKCYAAYMRSNQPCHVCPIHEAIRTGETQRVELDAADGRKYEVSSSSFTDVDGKVKVIELAKDVTEKMKMEAEAMRAGHLASLGELAAGIAHEINNPIGGIINYAEILVDQGGKDGLDSDIPERIIREGERIAQIVKNLLSFATDRNEEYSLTRINDILSDTLGLVEKQILKDGIKLRVSVPSDLPEIRARTQGIQQVFLNILSNARYALNRRYPGFHEDKILEIKGAAVEIEGQKHTRITFYDGGMGMPAGILEKISNPFFSTKPKGEGTGLGLSISYGIIRDHGGRLRFESEEGEYTRVVVDLPVPDS